MNQLKNLRQLCLPFLLLILLINFGNSSLLAQEEGESTPPSSSTAAVTELADISGIAVVDGQILEPIAYKDSTGFQHSPVRFSYDDPLNDELEIIAPVDEKGEFSIELSLDRPMPMIMRYDQFEVPIFLSPKRNLTVKALSTKFLETLQFEGDAGNENNYLIRALDRNKYNTVDEDLVKKYEMGETFFPSHCDELRVAERAFLTDYSKENPTNYSFRAWAEAEVKYRAANRVCRFYYKTEEPEEDGYTDFASEYNLNDLNAITSRQYLDFLDHHFRHLTRRDPLEVRLAREEINEPWVVRAFELANEKLRGEVRDRVLARLLNYLIAAEHQGATYLYEQFKGVCETPSVKALIDKRFEKLSGFLTAAPPPGANLHILEKGNPTTFDAILSRYRGDVLYIDFWASWCEPCLAEMPYSSILSKGFVGKDVTFIYMSSDENEGNWRGNITRNQVRGEHYLMNATLYNEVKQRLNMGTIPRYVLVNKTGEIVNPDAPKPSDNALLDALNTLMAE